MTLLFNKEEVHLAAQLYQDELADIGNNEDTALACNNILKTQDSAGVGDIAAPKPLQEYIHDQAHPAPP